MSSLWPENSVLFVGGPWHGQRKILCGSTLPAVFYVQGTNTYAKAMMPLVPSLRPCLELQEIEALTGSSCHREPRVLREELEREELSRHTYELNLYREMNNDLQLEDRWVYFDSKVPPGERNEAMQSAIVKSLRSLNE